MRVTILQPSYLAWVGAFEILARSDVFVIYDDVQYDRDGWRNRNKIKTQCGVQWLTVPVHAPLGCHILEAEIANSKWQRKHIETIRQAYAKAPYREEVLPEIEHWINLLGTAGKSLATLSMALFRAMARMGGINTSTVRVVDLDIGGRQTERLVNICRHFNATHYLTGPAAKDYLDVGMFEAAGIEVEWHNFIPRPYPQLHGEFISYLSFLDLLLNCGKDSIGYLTL